MIQKYLANCFLLMLSWLISRLYSIAFSHPCNACCDDSEHNTEDKEDKVFPIRWDSGTLVGPLRETQKTEILAGYMQGPRTRPIQVPHYFHYFITVTHYETQVTGLHLNCVFWISARHLIHQSISKKKGLKLGQLRQPMWRLWNKVSFLCTLHKKNHFVLSDLQKSKFDQVTCVKNNYEKCIQISIQISSHWQSRLPMLVISRHLIKFSGHYNKFPENWQKKTLTCVSFPPLVFCEFLELGLIRINSCWHKLSSWQ